MRSHEVPSSRAQQTAARNSANVGTAAHTLQAVFRVVTFRASESPITARTAAEAPCGTGAVLSVHRSACMRGSRVSGRDGGRVQAEAD